MSTTAGGGAAPMIPMGAHAAQESRYRAPSHGAPGPGRGPPDARARAPGAPRSGGPAANARRGPPSAGHPAGQPSTVRTARGRVRDLDMVAGSVATELGALEGSTHRESRALLRRLDADRDRAWDRLHVVLDGARYSRLLRRLKTLPD